MKKIITYISLDGTKFKSEKECKKHDYKTLKECFAFWYNNPTCSCGEDTPEKYDFASYGVNSKETIKNILELIERI
jgi:hypothetical protein